jgi:hypothetical protein
LAVDGATVELPPALVFPGTGLCRAMFSFSCWLIPDDCPKADVAARSAQAATAINVFMSFLHELVSRLTSFF